MAGVELRRGGDRYRTAGAGVETLHSFSFGPHYDPTNTGMGPLVLHDEHRLAPGAGFPPHRHAGVEVVSWVLDGTLVHEDGSGRRRELGAGSLQHLSTGSGVVHAERAGADGVRFVQSWLIGSATTTSYASRIPVLEGLTPVLTVGSARLWAARLSRGERLELPAAPLLHVFLARGHAALAGQRLAPGDVVRTTDSGRRSLLAEKPAELLVWEMHTTDTSDARA